MKFQQKLTIITATVNGRLFETGEHAFNEVVIKTLTCYYHQVILLIG